MALCYNRSLQPSSNNNLTFHILENMALGLRIWISVLKVSSLSWNMAFGKSLLEIYLMQHSIKKYLRKILFCGGKIWGMEA